MDEEVALLGMLTAGMTHEIRNVLAIIKESSGLMQDILAMNRGASLPGGSAFPKGVETIQRQTDRGFDLLALQGRLAHSMDDPECTQSVGEVLALASQLMQRFALRRGKRVEILPCDPALSFRGDLFRLLMAVAGGVDYCLREGAPAAPVTLEGRKTEVGIQVRIATERADGPRGTPEAASAVLDGLESMTSRLGAELRAAEEGPRLALLMIIPQRQG